MKTKVVNAKTEAELFSLDGEFLCYSPDGTQIMTRIAETLHTWRAKDGGKTWSTAAEKNSLKLSSVTYSSDSKQLLICTHNQSVYVKDSSNGTTLRELNGHAGKVVAAYSPDGSYIATVEGRLHDTFGDITPVPQNHAVRIWDNRPPEQIFRTHESAHPLTAIPLAKLYGHINYIHTVKFSPDGSQLLTSSRDGTAKIWHFSSGADAFRCYGHTAEISSMAFSPDSSRLVTAARRPAEGAGFGGGNMSPFSVSRFVNNPTMFDNASCVWNCQTGKLEKTLAEQESKISVAAFSADGTSLVTGAGELRGYRARLLIQGDLDKQGSTAKLWDVKTGQVKLTLQGHKKPITAAHFNLAGTHVVTGSWDHSAKVWDAKTGAEILTLRGHKQGITSVQYSPDGRRIVTGSGDWTAKIWDAHTGAEILSLKGHTKAVLSARWSPNGTRIITGGDDTTAKIWKADVGEILITLQGHSGAVTSACYSPDGTRILTGSDDWTAKLWDASLGIDCLTLRGHAASVTTVAFCPDGSRIATGGEDYIVFIWDARSIRAPEQPKKRKASPVKEPTDIQACWQLVSVESSGKRYDYDGLKPWFLIQGDKVVYGGEETCRISSDPSTNPASLDLRFRDPDMVYQGIYSLEKGVLRVCFNMLVESEDDRPGVFSTMGQLDWRMFVFERKKTIPTNATEGLAPFAGIVTRDAENKVVLSSLVHGGQAEKAGLKQGDVILKIGAASVTNVESATKSILAAKPGEKLDFLVRRANEQLVITVTLGVVPLFR